MSYDEEMKRYDDGRDWVCPDCHEHYTTFDALDACYRGHHEEFYRLRQEKKIVETTNMGNEPRMPVKKIRVRGVTVTFWENDGKTDDSVERKFLTATIERSYKDKQGEWQTSNSYMSGDLDTLAIAVREAQHYANIEYPQSKKEQ